MLKFICNRQLDTIIVKMKERDRFQLITECCDIWNKTKNN